MIFCQHVKGKNYQDISIPTVEVGTTLRLYKEGMYWKKTVICKAVKLQIKILCVGLTRNLDRLIGAGGTPVGLGLTNISFLGRKSGIGGKGIHSVVGRKHISVSGATTISGGDALTFSSSEHRKYQTQIIERCKYI